MNFVIRFNFCKFQSFNIIHYNNIVVFISVVFINLWNTNIINIFKVGFKSFYMFHFIFKINLFKQNMSVSLEMLLYIYFFEKIITHQLINDPFYFTDTFHHSLINISSLYFDSIGFSIFITRLKHNRNQARINWFSAPKKNTVFLDFLQETKIKIFFVVWYII